MKAIGQLDHPNIVKAHDAREIDGIAVLVMEFVEGKSLADLVREHEPLAIPDACELIRQAAVGLDCAHRRGLIHRDIKPSNLILSSAGEVKILDFGLALVQETTTEAGSELTTSNQMMGTVDYMAPEQALDAHAVDIRADIYSLGCTLYRLLTGHAPFGGSAYDTPIKKMMAHTQKVPPSVQEFRSDVPDELVAIIGRLMAKEPAERYATPGAVADALGAFTSDCDLPTLIDEAIGQPATEVGTQEAAAGRESISVSAETVSTNVNQLARVPSVEFGEASASHPEAAEPVSSAVAGKEGRREFLRRRFVMPAIGLLSLVAFALIAWGITIYWRTDGVTVKVEIDDSVRTEDVSVWLDRKELRIEGLGDRIRLTRGGHVLEIKRGDVVVKTQDFRVVENDKPLLQISLADQEGAAKEAVTATVAEEPASGFVSLFDGKTLDGWEGSTTHYFVEDGNLICDFGHGRESSGKTPSHLFSTNQYDDFILRLEFKMEAGANSGVFVRAPRRENLVNEAMEIQIIDDHFPQFSKFQWSQLWKLTGAIHGVVAAKPGHLKPAGEWNSMEILCDRRRVGVALNGVNVVDVDLDEIGDRTFVNLPNTGLKRKTGHIGFIGHGSGRRVDYRNIRIKELKGQSDDEPRRAENVGPGSPALAIAPFDAAQAKKLQQQWADYLGMPAERENSIGMKLVLTPPGEFLMGSTSDEIDDVLETMDTSVPTTVVDSRSQRIPTEGPQHRVTISRPFYLGVSEVTQAEYRQVMESNPSAFSATGSEAAKVAGQDTDRHPVDSISWEDAQEFCRRLSAREGGNAGRIYRLPTEAEWEYACRAGTTTRWVARNGTWGLKERAWFNANADMATHPVGQKLPNPFGICDMAGNLNEWCADWYGAEYYHSSPEVDPSGPTEGSERARRGGCWRFGTHNCRSAYRSGAEPTNDSFHNGFRVVWEVPRLEKKNRKSRTSPSRAPSP